MRINHDIMQNDFHTNMKCETNIKLSASTVIVAGIVGVAIYCFWRGRKIKANQEDVKGIHQAVKKALQPSMIRCQENGPISSQTEGPWEAWDSLEGMTRLKNSDAKANFWNLVRFYESQIRLTYCSIATSVMALNALGIEAPLSKFLGRYQMFTQEEFFSTDVSKVIDPNEVLARGMSLEELTKVLRAFPVTVLKYEAQQLSQEEMRRILISALKNPNQCVLALYQRRAFQQIGGGHWSPIAAYDAKSDSFLVLDVARFKYPPVWVDATAFIRAMQTNNLLGSRGFLILEKK
ncbi:MAG: phytochelatin synthase family protein [Verrucomicrobia bacterium]|nr:phytochelatin synthase family protein [Verrucomicrobiota bacterium]